MPALLVALACAGALVALGDLRARPAEAIALLVAWGLLVLAMHLLDLRRHALGHLGALAHRSPEHEPLTRPGPPPWRLDVRRLSPLTVLLAALAVRLPLLASPPTLSDDVYRYAWEGWLTLHGGNPYLTPPAVDPGAMDHPVRLLVNHPEVSTIYPPVALWLFAALAALSPTALVFKAAMGVADALTAAALAGALRARGRSTAGAWLYALMPLGAVEAAGSGHLEAAAVCCLALSLWAWSAGRAGLGFAVAGALLKLLPGVLVPSLWRRRPWLLLLGLGVGLVAALPFREAGPHLLRGLGTYVEHWSFNASGFRALGWLLGPVLEDPRQVRLVALLLGALAVLRSWWTLRDPARVALWVGGAFVLLSPTVHPWYLLWVWVPSLLLGVRSWTVLALLAPLSYAALQSYDPATGTWQEPAWPVWAQYLPLLLAALMESLWHQLRPGPWSPSPLPSPPSPAPSRSASPT